MVEVGLGFIDTIETREDVELHSLKIWIAKTRQQMCILPNETTEKEGRLVRECKD